MSAFTWWLYIISGALIFFFLAPMLISAPSTLAVLLGVLILALYGVWSWKLWLRDLFDKLLEDL